MLNEAVIVCIAKNEERYINEWIYYHLKIGFSKIIIYDNSDYNSLFYLNQSWYGKVIVYHFPGKGKTVQLNRPEKVIITGGQTNAYDDYIVNWRKRNLLYKWVAFLDCDEFIQLFNGEDILHFFHRVNFHEGVLNLNWLYYGSNGHDKYTNEPILQRFTKRQTQQANILHKTICVITDVKYFMYPGHIPYTDKFYRDSENKRIKRGFYTDPSCTKDIALAHFFVKSKEEWQSKMDRGNKHTDIKTERTWDTFNMHDINQIEDLSLLHILKSSRQKNTLNVEKNEDANILNFDYDSYLWNNSDLFQANIVSPEALIQHYNVFGKIEIKCKLRNKLK